jgi:hypothetical protein
LPDLHFTGDSQCLPLYRYNDFGKQPNITDWGLMQFREHYKDKRITREDIFITPTPSCIIPRIAESTNSISSESFRVCPSTRTSGNGRRGAKS